MFKRCFSKNPQRVAECATAAIQAYQDAGIFPVIKHLPGHGKAIDSHKELPTINASEKELTECDIAASKMVIQNLNLSNRPLPGAMVSHVIYNALDSNFPASFSKIIISKVIRDRIGIKNNLIFSDDLRMQAVVKFLAKQNVNPQNFWAAAINGFLNAGGDIAIIGPITQIETSPNAFPKNRKIMRKILKFVKSTSHIHN